MGRGWFQHSDTMEPTSPRDVDIRPSYRHGEDLGLKLNMAENWNHDIQAKHFMADRWGYNGNSERLYFLGLQNHCG